MTSNRQESSRGAVDAARPSPSPLMPFAAVVLMGTVLLAGCNTIEGFGRDVEAAGGEVSETAEEVREGM